MGGIVGAISFIHYAFFGDVEALGPFSPAILLVGSIAMLGRAWWLKRARDNPMAERMSRQYGNPILDKLDAYYMERNGNKDGYLIARQGDEKINRSFIDTLMVE